MITHSAKETRQEKKQWGWVLEVTGKLGCEQNLKKGLGNRGGGGGVLHNRGLALLCQLCKDFKNSQSPHYKTNPLSFLASPHS